MDKAKFVKAKERVWELNSSERSGDIILVFRSDTDAPVEDRYTSGVACKAWHSSLNRSDSYVPLIISYPGGTKSQIEKFVNAQEVCGTDMTCKWNRKVTDMIKSIIGAQY